MGLKEGEIITMALIAPFLSAGLCDSITVRFEHLGDVTVTF